MESASQTLSWRCLLTLSGPRRFQGSPPLLEYLVPPAPTQWRQLPELASTTGILISTNSMSNQSIEILYLAARGFHVFFPSQMAWNWIEDLLLAQIGLVDLGKKGQSSTSKNWSYNASHTEHNILSLVSQDEGRVAVESLLDVSLKGCDGEPCGLPNWGGGQEISDVILGLKL